MKSVISILSVIFFSLILIVSCSEQSVDTPISQNVNIPDASFKSKILDAGYDINNDGEISYSEAQQIYTLDVSEPDPTSTIPKIKRLTGIEAFTNMTYFNCYGNNISGEVDFSKNINLTTLNIGVNNGITALNLTNLIQLRKLDILFNNLSSLDLSTNINLQKLHISFTRLTHIDVSKNTNLYELSLFANLLTNIDLSKNIHLKKLIIGGAQQNIDYLDISNLKDLEDLSITYMGISLLDISKNKKIKKLSLGFLENLSRICVWELPLPDTIA
ncbi:MAG: hypothetical protein GXO85_12930, partial [Chlorobi bacterium]|nr:hypothetical protein [Chlorobiota bacterium]